MDRPLIDVAILIYNCLNYTKETIESMIEYTNNYHCILIDNSSTEHGIKEYLKKFKNDNRFTVMLNSYNLGVPLGWNEAILNMKSDYGIVICNNDLVFTPNWIEKMYAISESDPMIQMIGFNSSYSACIDQREEESFKKRKQMNRIEILKYAKEIEKKYNGEIKDAEITGFAFFLRRKIIDEIGGFSWRVFLRGSGEEALYRWKIKKLGYRTVCAKSIYLQHRGHASFDSEMKPSKSLKLWRDNVKKYYEQIKKIDSGEIPIYVPIEEKINRKDLVWLDKEK